MFDELLKIIPKESNTMMDYEPRPKYTTMLPWCKIIWWETIEELERNVMDYKKEKYKKHVENKLEEFRSKRKIKSDNK